MTREWPRVKLGYLVREAGGATPSKDHLAFWNGRIPWVSPKDMKIDLIADSQDHVTEEAVARSSLRLVPAGSVLMVVRGMILAHTVPVAEATVPVTLNQDMKALLPTRRLWPRFLRYSMTASQPDLLSLVEVAGHGTCCLRSEQWRKLEVGVPPLPTQRAIAAFLDRKTAAIDALIDKKERLVALLAEKRAALLEDVLSQVAAPEVRLAHIVSLLPGYAFPSDGFTEDPQDVRLLRGVNVAPGALRWEDVARWPNAATPGLEAWLLQPGDLVLGMDRPWISGGLRLAVVRETDCPCLLLQRVARLRVGPAVEVAYLRYTLEWGRFKAHLEPETTGVSVPHVSGEQILSYRIPLPARPFRAEVVRRLSAESERLEETSALLRNQIDKLREYRQALITAAVTGRIDIPPEAA